MGLRFPGQRRWYFEGSVEEAADVLQRELLSTHGMLFQSRLDDRGVRIYRDDPMHAFRGRFRKVGRLAVLSGYFGAQTFVNAAIFVVFFLASVVHLAIVWTDLASTQGDWTLAIAMLLLNVPFAWIVSEWSSKRWETGEVNAFLDGIFQPGPAR